MQGLEIPCSSRSGPAARFFEPCEILFTQATIKSKFKNGKSLEETACQLACSDIQKRDLPMIRVVRHEGFMYSLDNRRLAVFRLLQLTGIIRRIKVLVVPMDEKQWRSKFDPESDHTQIRVRGLNLLIGSSLETTTFPLEKIRRAGAFAHDATAVLELLLHEMDSDDEAMSPQVKAGYPRPDDQHEASGDRAGRSGRKRRRHILQYSKSELMTLGWTGEQYFSHSQRRMAPYIAGMDSDSDYSYDDLHNVPEHLLPKTWKP